MKHRLIISRLCFAAAAVFAVISVLSIDREGSGLLIPMIVPSVITGLIGVVAKTPVFIYIAFLLASPVLIFLNISQYWFIGAFPLLLLLSAVMLPLPLKKPVPLK